MEKAPGTSPFVSTGQRDSEVSTDLLRLILQAAAVSPDRPALSGQHGRTLQYRDLAIAVVATAKGLRRSGFLPGERLVSSLRHDAAAVVLALASVAAGGSVVLIDPGADASLLASTAALTGAGWIAAESEVYATKRSDAWRFVTRRRGTERPDYPALGVRTLRSGPWRPGVPSGTLSLRGLAQRGAADNEPLSGLQAEPAAEAAVLFTSGTRDRPRAVVHTRGSLGSGLSGLADRLHLGDRAVIFTDQLLMGLPALTVGAHWRLPPVGLAARIDPVRFIKSLGKATHTFLYPADLAAVLDAIAERLAPRPPALEEITVAGSAVPTPLVVRTLAALPELRLRIIYGTTEMLPIAVAEGTDKLLPDPAGDFVGKLQPGIRARIADDGELVVAGPSLAGGYLGEPPLSEHRTGDLAILRDRSVVLLGRKQDMIVRGRTRIYPAVHEPVIETLPGVSRAALIGVPDDIGKDQVILALQPAGQPVNDKPLAGQHNRSDSAPEGDVATQVAVLLHHPLAAAVAARLPALVDPVTLPDHIVVVSAIPTAGRERRPDRTALRRLLAEAVPED